MEQTGSCYYCKKSYSAYTTFSCKHRLCQKCILRFILKKHLLELPDKETIIIKCKCKAGSIDSTLKGLYDIIVAKVEETKATCTKHSKLQEEFCIECNRWLCAKCLDSHADLFANHKLTKTEETIREICGKHEWNVEAYCENCKSQLCEKCFNDHASHVVINGKDQKTKINDQLQRLQFKSFETFNAYLAKIEKEFDTAYNNNLASTQKTVETIIGMLTKMVNEYKEKMKVKFDKKQQIMSIIKKVYNCYYGDIKEALGPSSNKIKFHKFLSKQYSEFCELNFASDIDSICDKLNKVKPLIEGQDIASSVKVSYAYFSKKDLQFKMTENAQHKDVINAVIELKDGKIVTASEDKTISVFDANCKCLFVLLGHICGVRSLCQLKDGRIASGSADKTIRIWDSKEFKTVNILREHNNAVISLIQLDNGKFGSCSYREIVIRDKEFRAKYFLRDHTDWVKDFIHIDYNKYASCSQDTTIRIYDKHFNTLNVLKDHTAHVGSIAKLRDCRVVSGDSEGTLIVWSREFCYNKIIKEHKGGICAIIQIKDGRVVTACLDKLVRVWDLDFKGRAVFDVHHEGVLCLFSLRDGGIISGGMDRAINVWR